jgi:hypothetical protein
MAQPFSIADMKRGVSSPREPGSPLRGSFGQGSIGRDRAPSDERWDEESIGSTVLLVKGSDEWKKDQEAKSCHECLKNFSIRRRKHHCRGCGGIFCRCAVTSVDYTVSPGYLHGLLHRCSNTAARLCCGVILALVQRLRQA